MKQQLVLYVVFDHPRDFPRSWVVRQQIVQWDPAEEPGQSEVVIGDFWVGPSIEAVRSLIPADKVRIDPLDEDDPKIAEVWI